MPLYKVTYQCQNRDCKYQDILEIVAISKAAAWKTASICCPSHKLLGDMLPVKVDELLIRK
jgi:hypothetical protein